MPKTTPATTQMAMTREGTPRIPLLADMQLHPQCCRASAHASTFLKRIDYVEVTHAMGTKNDYAIQVFFERPQSQIPTVNRHKELYTQLSLKKTTSRQTTHRRQPDAVVMRSFTEFEELRKTINTYLDRENRGGCRACNEWMSFMTLSMAPTSVWMKLVPSSMVRQSQLTKFVNAAVILAIQRTVQPSNRKQCAINDSIAQFICEFLQPRKTVEV